MVELKTKRGIIHPVQTFHFRTMDDCKKFMYVFQDHWCNIPWEDPVEIPDYTKINDDRYIDADPVARAEDNLSWGFSALRFHNMDTLTGEQQSMLSGMVSVMVNQ